LTVIADGSKGVFLEVVPCDVLFADQMIAEKSVLIRRDGEEEGETHLNDGSVPLVDVQRVECRVALGVTANVPFDSEGERVRMGERTGKQED
jgi:hypothetical protein